MREMDNAQYPRHKYTLLNTPNIKTNNNKHEGQTNVIYACICCRDRGI